MVDAICNAIGAALCVARERKADESEAQEKAIKCPAFPDPPSGVPVMDDDYKVAELLDHSLEHVRRSRLEPGCIMHSAQLDTENELRVVYYEEWADMAALQAHFEVPESKDFVEKISALCTTPPVMKIYNATQIK